MAKKKRLTLKDVKYVRLEPVEYIKEFAMQSDWGCEEMGCYRMLIDHLYVNGGFIELDLEMMAKLCRCRKSKFVRIWNRIGHKFSVRGKRLYHKRCMKELRMSMKYMQVAYQSGVKGSEVRWKKEPKRPASSAISLSLSMLDRIQKMPGFVPKTLSDRSALNNLTKWAEKGLLFGTLNEDDITRVLTYASEVSKNRNAKNHFAMFFAILKREMGYKPQK